MDEAPQGVLFQVLGPFEAVVDGHPVALGGARQGLVLAALVARANAVVSTDRLVDIVWGDEPPESALSTVQKYVYRLRSVVGPDRLVTRPPGYLLRVGEGESDASRFESLLAMASRLGAAGELAEAKSSFDAALALWRGPAWGELADFDFVRGDAVRLEGLRAAAIDDRIEIVLAIGRHAEVIGELEAIVADYPLRERPRGQLMLALYRAGRHADALRAYETYRRYLGEEVGLEPSAHLVQLADAIVLQKPELDWVAPAAAPVQGASRHPLPSGTVTFLLTDIEGSTALFRRLGHAYVEVLERHRELVRGGVAHGGGVEVNAEGDGLFFAFSSAAGALGAAVSAQGSLATEPWPQEATVRVRMGLHTGEAEPRDGDYVALAVHQAARVKDAAHGGQVLLSQATAAAIGEATPGQCSLHGLGTYALKDFDDGVDLFEARHPSLGGPFPAPRIGPGLARHLQPLPAPLTADTEPLVGRTNDLEWLEVLWQRAVAGERVTAAVYGPRGIGKSRLLAEFARRVHAGGATVTYQSGAIASLDATGELTLTVLDDLSAPNLHVLCPECAGVLIVAASREPPYAADNARELSSLDATGVGALLMHSIEGVTTELRSAVWAETSGNPALVRDVAERLREHDAAGRAERALARIGVATLEARQLRDDVAASVLERGRLAPQARDGVALGVCPYKGLGRYEAADAPFFYGRERLVAALVARLAADRFVGVIGASGSGKSSLVRAGLLPALSAGALPGSDAWPTCTCTPGEHPLRSLAEAVAPLVNVPGPELARRLDRQPDELGAILEAAVRGRDGARVVVVVDQFEEVATLCRDQEERERFAGTLVDAVTDPDVPVVLVPVVRADYYGALAVHPELAQMFEQSQVLVGAMSDAQLRRAITEPAQRAGLVLEDGLVDAVCEDAGPEAAALPLVSTAMAETWVRRDGSMLSLAAYRDAGGVHGALARLADDVHGGLDEGGQGLARRLFLRLAEPGEGTDDVRRRMPRGEVGGEDADAVLEAFVGRRLLVADSESVEVAHEALLREWPRLRAWLEEDRAGRRLHRQLTLAAASWEGEGRDPGALYRGTRLDAALEWAGGAHSDDVNVVEREFLDVSLDAQHSELRRARRIARRLRSLAVAMAIFLAVALVAGGVALVQRSRANDQAAAARAALVVSDAARLAGQARVFPAGQLTRALLLAVQGRRLNDSTATDGALEAVLASVPPGVERQVFLSDVGLLPFSTDASPDGHLIAAGDIDGTAHLYDDTSGSPVRSLPGNPGVPVLSVQFSADGTRLVGSDLNGDVFLWDIASGRRLGTTIHTVPGYEGEAKGFTRTAFTGDNRIVTATNNGEVTVWDIRDAGHAAPIGAPYAGTFVYNLGLNYGSHALLGPGSDLLAFDNAGNTQVWDIRTHTLAYSPLPGFASGESPDGSTLATAVGNQVFLWDLATGRRRGEFRVGSAQAPLGGLGPIVLFSPDGRRAAITSTPPNGDGTVTVVDLPSGAAVGHPITGQGVRYLDDGRIAVGEGQTIELWRPDAAAPVPFATVLSGARTPGLAHWLSSTTVYVLPQGARPSQGAFTLSSRASEWDAATGKPLGDLLGPPQPPAVSVPITDSIVNHDGTLAALGEGDKVALWDIRHRRQAALLDPGQRQPVAVWDPTANILATTGVDGTVALWDASDVAHPRLLNRFPLPRYPAGYGPPLCFFSPDGRTIAVQAPLFANNPSTYLVSVPDGRVRAIAPSGGNIGTGAVFSSDSKTIAISEGGLTTNGFVTLWDLATGRRRSLTVSYPQLAGPAFAYRDRWLVTVQSALIRPLPPDQESSRVELWDAETLQPLGDPILVMGSSVPIEIDGPGGSLLLSGTEASTGAYTVWDLDPTHWQATACNIAGRNLTQAEWKQYLGNRPYQRTCPQWPAGR